MNCACGVCFRYRKWDLGNDIVLIARCEHDAVMYGPNNEVQFINIKSLNEWDSRVMDTLPPVPSAFRVFVVAVVNIGRKDMDSNAEAVAICSDDLGGSLNTQSQFVVMIGGHT